MADENTNDSQTSTTAADAQSATSTDQSSSTTAETPKADDGTILTPPADDTGAEAKGDEGKAEGDQQTGDEGSEPNAFLGAPEGDYEITGLPEGMAIDTDALAAITPIAKEIGLSNEGLSKIAGVYAEKVLPAVSEQVVKQITEDGAAQRRDWDAETRLAIAGGKDAEGKPVEADAAFGGKKFDEVVSVAHKAVRRFGGEEFANFLETTGLGNHPAMVKAMFQAGSQIAEDQTFDRGAGGGKPQSKADLFYPKATT